MCNIPRAAAAAEAVVATAYVMVLERQTPSGFNHQPVFTPLLVLLASYNVNDRRWMAAGVVLFPMDYYNYSLNALVLMNRELILHKRRQAETFGQTSPLKHRFASDSAKFPGLWNSRPEWNC